MARAWPLTGALLPLHAHKSGFPRGIEPIGDVHIYIEKIMLRNCLIQLWELASSTFVGQARRLEIQARVDVSVLNLWLEAWAEFLCCSLEAEFLLLWGTSVFVLKDFN